MDADRETKKGACRLADTGEDTWSNLTKELDDKVEGFASADSARGECEAATVAVPGSMPASVVVAVPVPVGRLADL